MKILLLRAAALVVAVLAAANAAALPFPSQPFTIVVSVAEGEEADRLARILAPEFAKVWGQPVNVENVTGDDGRKAAMRVATSYWDAYTLYLAPSATIGDPKTHFFAPVALVSTSPLAVVVAPKARIASLQDLVKQSKAKPGKLARGAVGDSRATGLAGDHFESVAGVSLARVQYATGDEAIAGLLAGKVNVAFVPLKDALAPVRARKVRAIAVSGLERAGALPGVPTVAESGFPGFEAVTWYGLMLPIATPRPLVSLHNSGANKVLALPEVRRKIGELGLEPAGGSIERIFDIIRLDREQWLRLGTRAAGKP
jgi:tripartite-type tricarboxylate transporter receptor subunit TctC